jgi:hypothetical protein
MMVFFKIWSKNFKKTIITLQALRFKLNCLNQKKSNVYIFEIDNAVY